MTQISQQRQREPLVHGGDRDAWTEEDVSQAPHHTSVQISFLQPPSCKKDAHLVFQHV